MSDLEQIAITRLREAALMSEKFYKKPLVVTTSGGKDSSVCVELALRAGINFELMQNHTTADAPETVFFLRSEFKRLEDMGFPSILCINVAFPVWGVLDAQWLEQNGDIESSHTGPLIARCILKLSSGCSRSASAEGK